MPQLREDFAKLEMPVCGVDGLVHCRCCGQIMEVPGVVVADAGQAFEAVAVSAVLTSLASLFALARAVKPKYNVSVRRQAGVSDTSGGSIYAGFFDRDVFTLDSLQQCVKAVLTMRVYRFADKYIV